MVIIVHLKYLNTKVIYTYNENFIPIIENILQIIIFTLLKFQDREMYYVLKLTI